MSDWKKFVMTWTVSTLIGFYSVFVLMQLLSCASVAAAKKHGWQEGTLVNITSEAPGATTPAAETVAGYQIKRAYYWIKVENIIYVLVNSWSVGFHAPKAPLNVTLNGKVKIAVEGKNVFILDDAGKEIERPLVAKIGEPAVLGEAPAKKPDTK